VPRICLRGRGRHRVLPQLIARGLDTNIEVSYVRVREMTDLYV